MSSIFRIGQLLKGKLNTYAIAKELRNTVWLAKSISPLYLPNSQHQPSGAHHQGTVVIKSVRNHPRVENERDCLRIFQNRTPFLRPVVDEVVDPALPATIVLRHLDDDLFQASIKRTLSRKELKYVCRRILEALAVLHKDGFVHTDVKLDNLFVNYRDGEIRFSDVQLGDLGGCYPADSKWATSGTLVGSLMWTSPEILMEIPWNTAADIWSFGTVLISLLLGGDFNLFRPKGVDLDRDFTEYLIEVVKKQYRWFGPFPPKFAEVCPPETVESIQVLVDQVPKEVMTPFRNVVDKEVFEKDKRFILKIMKLDWRDRPTAKQLLEDEWWNDDDE